MYQIHRSLAAPDAAFAVKSAPKKDQVEVSVTVVLV
jgi:hypothetical protein